MKTPKVAIIIVTHNSEPFFTKAMHCVKEQTWPIEQVIVVDSGSKDVSYLNDTSVIMAGVDIGFCKGNNRGYEALQKDIDYVFFLNPDAFLTPNFVEDAVSYMEQHPAVGALTGVALGYDLKADKPSGRYDTTGVFQTPWGKWYDRGQGKPIDQACFTKEEELKAICGAVFFARRSALDGSLIRGKEVFDSTFFMYKEDIDLSCRLRKNGWKLMFVPHLIAYHCRGWSPNRKDMPRLYRLCSARNELTIAWREKKPLACLFSLNKYLLVKCFDV